jgi:hypothetical protein
LFLHILVEADTYIYITSFQYCDNDIYTTILIINEC